MKVVAMTYNRADNLPAPGSYARVTAAEARDHPATLLVAQGLSLRQAAAQATAQGYPISHARLKVLVDRARGAYGDDWLPSSYLRRSQALAAPGGSTGATVARAYPVYGAVPAGFFNGSDQRDTEPDGSYVTDLHVRQHSGQPAPFALRVKGHSMANPASPVQFPDGSLVLCDPSETPYAGDFVVVLDSTNSDTTLKRLVNRDPKGRDLWLEPLNPSPEYATMRYEDDKHQIAGVVVDAVQPLYRKP